MSALAEVTKAREQLEYAATALDEAREDVELATSHDILAIRLEAWARQAETLTYWVREYARLMQDKS